MRIDKCINALWTPPRLTRFSAALLLLIVACSAEAGSPPTARGADDARISVTAVAGEVDATMAGHVAELEPEATLQLPARIVTGHDGTVGLTQAGTTISVANDTDVEIPAEAVDGNLIARLVQHSGNVFYDVAPRDLGKLRVETPFLVAVIKGTQFNVAVLENSTTISLFEGSLEIRTPDEADVVQLNAGEIAIRSLIDDTIRVVGMNDERVALPPAAVPPAASDAAAAPAVASDAAPAQTVQASDVATTDRATVADAGAAAEADSDAAAAKPPVDSGAPALDEIRVDNAAAVAVKPDVDLGGELVTTRGDLLGRADVVPEIGLDLAGGSLTLGIDVIGDARGRDDVGLGRAFDVRGGGVELALEPVVAVGTGSLDVILDTTAVVDTVDVGAGAGAIELDLGDVKLGGADVAPVPALDLDLGRGLDTGIDASPDLGGVVTPVDVGAALDAGPADLGLDVALDVGVGLDVGLDVALDVGVIELDLDSDDAASEPVVDPLPRRGRGLLGGLL
jgi:hypothetical protein